MGFRGIYSAILVTGLTQMMPAIAQSQPPLHEPDSMLAATPATRVADEQSRQPTPATELQAEIVRAKAIDPADKDLAAAPPEEVNPAKIDPNTARRAVASTAAAQAPRSAPQAVLAAAPAPQPMREEQEGYAERVVAAERALQPELGGDAAFAQSERLAGSQWHPTPRPAPQTNAERTPLPARDEREGYPASIQDDRVAIVPPRAAPYDRDGDASPAYAIGDREAPRGYDDRDPQDSARYAIRDRIGPDGPIRSIPEDRQWGNRQTAPIADRSDDLGCDGARTDRLQQRIRQEVDRGLIDPRAAQDLNDETAHAADLRRSYCASGMNNWREERLDRQYAQIEDRIRYEEDQNGRR